jgi:hypothetical protein
MQSEGDTGHAAEQTHQTGYWIRLDLAPAGQLRRSSDAGVDD